MPARTAKPSEALFWKPGSHSCASCWRQARSLLSVSSSTGIRPPSNRSKSGSGHVRRFRYQISRRVSSSRSTRTYSTSSSARRPRGCSWSSMERAERRPDPGVDCSVDAVSARPRLRTDRGVVLGRIHQRRASLRHRSVLPRGVRRWSASSALSGMRNAPAPRGLAVGVLGTGSLPAFSLVDPAGPVSAGGKS